MNTSLHELHYRGWHLNDRLNIHRVRRIDRMREAAERAIANRFPVPLEMVSGPITTGGLGNIRENVRVLRTTIEHLVLKLNIPVWSQVPFERCMIEFGRAWRIANPRAAYCMPILDSFYLPILRSGRIFRLRFIHGWESSFGARWEHDRCIEFGIERMYLQPGFASAEETAEIAGAQA
ncbi:MAG: hypothetical protein KGI45_03095 [Patescibacteria group bacterium]|nr:hypothetical protein [Patescibacteria group bacterium]MDE1940772.1 hypothetical protein [Patescibacteria group bacterium]MDE1967032.1 hypothetical protein [Patescibacteria group bacterium]